MFNKYFQQSISTKHRQVAEPNVLFAVPLTDVFMSQDFHLNRVTLEEGAGSEALPAGARPKKKNKRIYDLTAADKFWQKHKGR